MNYLLDTNICIHLIKRNPKVWTKAKHKASSTLHLSSVSIGELWFGAWKSSEHARACKSLEDFLLFFHELPFSSSHARVYGQIRADLQARSKLIGPNDLLIAAQALESQLILVTDNVRKFERIRGLRVENWLR